MTLAFADTRTFAAAPDIVWAVLTDWSRAHRWMPGVERMQADGPDAVGVVLRFNARGSERTSAITELEPGRSITLSSAQPGVRAHYRYRLAPVAQGTEISLEADVVTSGAMRLMGPVIRSAIAKADRPQLERLAVVVQSA